MQSIAARYEQSEIQLFEPAFDLSAEPELVRTAAESALTLGRLAMQFARVERVPRYDEHSRENDAEHSFMLGLVANELAAEYYPWLDRARVLEYSLVHDLIELETGDVATFTLTDAELAAKEAVEHEALEKLIEKLPPSTARAVIRYELQCSPEARFVRLIDKLLPVVVNIVGPGSKVMIEDYAITTTEQLEANEASLRQKLLVKFDEPHLALVHLARTAIAERFSEQLAQELAP